MKLGNHRNHSLEIRIIDLKSRTRFSKVLDPSARTWNHINLHRFHRHSQYKAHQALGVYLAAQWHRKGLKKATANVNNKEITILTINTAHVGYNNWLFNTLACAVTCKNRNFSQKKMDVTMDWTNLFIVLFKISIQGWGKQPGVSTWENSCFTGAYQPGALPRRCLNVSC